MENMSLIERMKYADEKCNCASTKLPKRGQLSGGKVIDATDAIRGGRAGEKRRGGLGGGREDNEERRGMPKKTSRVHRSVKFKALHKWVNIEGKMLVQNNKMFSLIMKTANSVLNQKRIRGPKNVCLCG